MGQGKAPIVSTCLYGIILLLGTQTSTPTTSALVSLDQVFSSAYVPKTPLLVQLAPTWQPIYREGINEYSRIQHSLWRLPSTCMSAWGSSALLKKNSTVGLRMRNAKDCEKIQKWRSTCTDLCALKARKCVSGDLLWVCTMQTTVGLPLQSHDGPTPVPL